MKRSTFNHGTSRSLELSLLFAMTLGFCVSALSVTPVVIKGNKFVYQDSGKLFNIKGICYQPINGTDPLSDDKYDAFVSDYNNYMKPLGINAIRIYQVEPDKSHDKIMNFLAENDVHVMIGTVNQYCCVTTFEDSDTHAQGLGPFRINWASGNTEKVVDAFSKYDNVMGFSVSNELILPPSSPNKKKGSGSYSVYAPSYVKELIKRTKAHIAAQTNPSYRKDIPIGLALRDTPPDTLQGIQYYISGTKSVRADFIGYNCERWAAGDEQGRINAYINFCQLLDQYGIDGKPLSYYAPIVFTEFSVDTCQDDYPSTTSIRKYKQVPYMFGLKMLTNGSTSVNMSDYINGGMVFRFLKNSQDFGIYIGTSGGTLSSNSNSDNTALTNEYAGVPGTGDVPPDVTIPDNIVCPSDNPLNKPIPSSRLKSDLVVNYGYELNTGNSLDGMSAASPVEDSRLEHAELSGTIVQVGLPINGFTEYIVKIKESDGVERFALILYEGGEITDVEMLDAIPADAAITQTGFYYLFYYSLSSSLGAYVFTEPANNGEISPALQATNSPAMFNDSRLKLKAKLDRKTGEATYTLTVRRVAFSDEAMSALYDGAMALIPGTGGWVPVEKLKLHEKRGQFTIELDSNPLAAIDSGANLTIFLMSNDGSFATWDAASLGN